MSERDYRRTFEQLESVASKFWPPELVDKELKLSIVPELLRTQDQFISILKIHTSTIEKLFNILDEADLSANLFVKHLVVLADYGGEKLSRISQEFNLLFPNGCLDYLWREQKLTYRFRSLPKGGMSNDSLGISGKTLLRKAPLSDLQRDAIAILMFGGSYSTDEHEMAILDEDSRKAISALAKCMIGSMIGDSDALEKFIRERYIWVSRIIGGAQSNSMGQLVQKFAKQYIEDNFQGTGIKVRSGRLPDVTHTSAETARDTSFDIIVTNGDRYVAIEVSFQETTNSVIERKSSQAKARFEQVEAAGHKIAYLLDGAGNFRRETALRVICEYSHCTVAFSRDELNILCEFLRKEFDL